MTTQVGSREQNGLTRRQAVGVLCLIPTLRSRAAEAYRVGSTATGIPFTFIDLKTNAVVGAMVDITRAIAKAAGFEIAFELTSFAALIPSLNAKKIDLVAAALLRTALRERVAAFSEPVYSYGPGIVISDNDARRYETIADLKGRLVGTQMGTRYGEQALAAGAQHVSYYDSLPDALHDLHAGRIEIAYGDAPILSYYIAHIQTSHMRFAQSFRPPSLEDVCLVVRKTDTLFLRRINEAITRIRPVEIAAILKRWKLT